jgi:hypothetical protein
MGLPPCWGTEIYPFTIMYRPAPIQPPVKEIPGDLHPLHGADNTSLSSGKV